MSAMHRTDGWSPADYRAAVKDATAINRLGGGFRTGQGGSGGYRLGFPPTVPPSFQQASTSLPPPCSFHPLIPPGGW